MPEGPFTFLHGMQARYYFNAPHVRSGWQRDGWLLPSQISSTNENNASYTRNGGFYVLLDKTDRVQLKTHQILEPATKNQSSPIFQFAHNFLPFFIPTKLMKKITNILQTCLFLSDRRTKMTSPSSNIQVKNTTIRATVSEDFFYPVPHKLTKNANSTPPNPPRSTHVPTSF